MARQPIPEVIDDQLIPTEAEAPRGSLTSSKRITTSHPRVLEKITRFLLLW